MLEEHTNPRRALRNRPARRGDERELALLKTAEELLNNGTLESTSLTEIAKRSGVSRAGFYFYFASKHALLSTLIVRTLDMLVEGLPSPGTEAHANPTQGLSDALHGAADLWCEHRAVLIAATELGSQQPTVFERIVETQRALIAPTATLLRRGTRVRCDDDARRLAEMFTWMAERNFYVISRTQPTRAALHAMADQLLDVWLAAAGLPSPADQREPTRTKADARARRPPRSTE